VSGIVVVALEFAVVLMIGLAIYIGLEK